MAAALKSLTAVGAEAPAGTARLYEIEFVGLVQVPAAQDEETPVTVDALVGARDQHFFSELGLEPHRPESLLLWEADLPNHLEDARGFEAVKIEALASAEDCR